MPRPIGIRTSLRRRGQRGQALPLGALGLLIMSLAVIATLNLGQAVHQRIRLQNSADAAAYSLAAMEARAFNFIALTNRAQIVHYNTAMALQSYLSYAGYCLGMFGTASDLVSDLAGAFTTACSTIPYPANAPWCALQGLYQAFARIAGMWVSILERVYKALHELAIPTIEAMGLFNKYAIWQMQLIRALQINAHLVTGMQDFVKANDPTMSYTGTNQWFNILLNSVLNSLEFQQTFDRGAGMNPFWLDALLYGIRNMREYKPNPGKEDIQDAMKVMTAIANASRSHQDIFDRSGMAFTSQPLGGGIVWGKKMGQTKLIEEGKPTPQIKEIRKNTNDQYKVGDTLASDDYLKTGFGGAVAGIAGVIMWSNAAKKIGDGIIADDQGGKHYKYEHPGSGAYGSPTGMSGIFAWPTGINGNVATTFTRDGDNDHQWQGLAPFFKFRPKDDKNADFNQPSTWIFLNKHHDSFQTGSGAKGRPWHRKFRLKHGSQPYASLDTTVGGKRNSYLFQGLNVVSRGMVYYHRPGNWAEHPNLFNPYWRARLAPVGSKLMNIWDKFVGSKIQLENKGEDNRVARMVVNFVRNMVSDFLLRTVTAVMTH